MISGGLSFKISKIKGDDGTKVILLKQRESRRWPLPRMPRKYNAVTFPQKRVARFEDAAKCKSRRLSVIKTKHHRRIVQVS